MTEAAAHRKFPPAFPSLAPRSAASHLCLTRSPQRRVPHLSHHALSFYPRNPRLRTPILLLFGAREHPACRKVPAFVSRPITPHAARHWRRSRGLRPYVSV